MAYAAVGRVIISNGEGSDADDLNTLQSVQVVHLNDFIVEPTLNMDPGGTAYPYLGNAVGYIWSEGVQPLARPRATSNTITNKAGTIYYINNGVPDPEATDPLIWAIDLEEDALQQLLVPDPSQQNFAAIGLSFSEGPSETASRRFKDDTTRAITTQVTNKRRVITVTVNVTYGTPGSGVVPAFTGKPWAVVNMSAGHTGVFTVEQVSPMAFPRVVDRIHVPALQGYAGTGVMTPTADLPTKTVWMHGLDFKTTNASQADVSYNDPDTSSPTGAVGIVSTNTPYPLACGIVGLTGNDRITSVNIFGKNQGTRTGTLALVEPGFIGTTVYDSDAVPASTGAFTVTLTASPYAVANSVVTFATSGAQANGIYIYGVLVNAYTYVIPDGFVVDAENQSIAASGTGQKYYIPCPNISPNKRIVKILAYATDLAGKCSLVKFAAPATAQDINIVVSTATMDTVLSSDSFVFESLPGSVWCSCGISPFHSQGSERLYFLWEPDDGDVLAGIEFILAGQ